MENGSSPLAVAVVKMVKQALLRKSTVSLRVKIPVLPAYIKASAAQN